MNEPIDTDAVRARWRDIDGYVVDDMDALCDEVDRLRAALREAKSDLLRYGRHDSDCPAREYVMVDGIPTTCDCGLDAALAPDSDQLPVPEQTTTNPMGDLGTSGYVKVIPKAPGGES